MSYLQTLQKANNSNVKNVFDLALQDPNKKSLAMANFSQVITNYGLSKCDPVSTASAVVQMTNLGFSAATGESYVIPYGNSAQFQLGYKGLISLALRSGQILKLNAAPIYDGEYKGYDRITDEHIFETKMEKQDESKIIGYVGYLKLKSGFEKTIYMTKEELHIHFSKFSKNNYDINKRQWKSDIITVDLKSKITVLKQLISKWAPKDASMDLALKVDGATFTEQGTMTYAESETKGISNRTPADKQLILDMFKVVGAIAKEQSLVKTQKEFTTWANTRAKEAGIDFGVSNGWYGITLDELKAFCIIVENVTGEQVVIQERRLSQEKPEAEKEQEYDL